MFKKGKTLPVLKTTLAVEVVDGHHLLTVLWKFQTPTYTASVRVKSCKSNHIPVAFVSRRDGKLLLDRLLLKMSRVMNNVSETVTKDD